jgi:hypothetical protein
MAGFRTCAVLGWRGVMIGMSPPSPSGTEVQTAGGRTLPFRRTPIDGRVGWRAVVRLAVRRAPIRLRQGAAASRSADTCRRRAIEAGPGRGRCSRIGRRARQNSSSWRWPPAGTPPSPREQCLARCSAPAWSQVPETVAEVLSPPDGLILFCGMSIGYADPTVSYARTGRARSTRRSRSSAVVTRFTENETIPREGVRFSISLSHGLIRCFNLP